MSGAWRILLQNSVLFDFPMSAFSISGRFRARIRRMPGRDLALSVCCFGFEHGFQVVLGIGGDLPTYLASFLRFCAVAARSTSSRAPVSPLSLKRSSLRRAKAISTFMRSRRDRSKAFVLANART